MHEDYLNSHCVFCMPSSCARIALCKNEKGFSSLKQTIIDILLIYSHYIVSIIFHFPLLVKEIENLFFIVTF